MDFNVEVQALTKGAVIDATAAFSALAADDSAARLPGSNGSNAGEASDMDHDEGEDGDVIMQEVPARGGRPGKKKASEGFKQKVRNDHVWSAFEIRLPLFHYLAKS